MQMIGRWRMLALARFLREFFADDEDSDSLITDSRTLIAGYTDQHNASYATNVIINVTLAKVSFSLHPTA